MRLKLGITLLLTIACDPVEPSKPKPKVSIDRHQDGEELPIEQPVENIHVPEEKSDIGQSRASQHVAPDQNTSDQSPTVTGPEPQTGDEHDPPSSEQAASGQKQTAHSVNAGSLSERQNHPYANRPAETPLNELTFDIPPSSVEQAPTSEQDEENETTTIMLFDFVSRYDYGHFYKLYSDISDSDRQIMRAPLEEKCENTFGGTIYFNIENNSKDYYFDYGLKMSLIVGMCIVEDFQPKTSHHISLIQSKTFPGKPSPMIFFQLRRKLYDYCQREFSNENVDAFIKDHSYATKVIGKRAFAMGDCAFVKKLSHQREVQVMSHRVEGFEVEKPAEEELEDGQRYFIELLYDSAHGEDHDLKNNAFHAHRAFYDYCEKEYSTEDLVAWVDPASYQWSKRNDVVSKQWKISSSGFCMISERRSIKPN